VKRLGRRLRSPFRDQPNLLDVTFALVGLVSLAALTFSLATGYLEEERHIEERKAIERSFGDPSNEHERQIEELKAIQRSTIDPSYQQKELAAPRGTTGLPLWP
jgi:hypothetical protein